MITYIATNTLNGKFYIGSTVNFSKRKNNHLRSKLNYPFQSALRRHPDKFIWETWDDDSDEPILEQALLDMWFGKECCYNLNPVASRPPQSLEIRRKAGNTVKELGKGIHSPEWLNSEECLNQRMRNGLKSKRELKGYFSLPAEERSRIGYENGKELKEEGKGIFDPDYINSEEKREASRRGGLTQGYRHKENNTGLFNPNYLNSEAKRQASINGGRKAMTAINKQRWQCTVTGHISNPGNLTRYQRSRGIDTSNRVRILENLQPTTSMNINEYQQKAIETAIYPNLGNNLPYVSLGLSGETGEVAEKVKKLIRDKGGVLTDPYREAIALEASDVCWYLAMLAYELDYSLEEIFQMNLDKLASRAQRGVLSGNGDNR